MVHQFHKFLTEDPMYPVAVRSQGNTLTISAAHDQSRLNLELKQCARAVGDPDASIAGTHGMRRGFARELALAGADPPTILERGDWRTAAFKAYIMSVQDKMVAQALLKMSGEHSDSE